MNFAFSWVSRLVRVLFGRRRARRVKRISVGVLRREFVWAKMLGDGACGFRPVQAGRERKRNREVVTKRMFRARAAGGGKGRGWGRWAREERREL